MPARKNGSQLRVRQAPRFPPRTSTFHSYEGVADFQPRCTTPLVMNAVDRLAVRLREATAADSLAVAEVNLRSLQASFPRRRLEPDELSLDRRAAMFRRRFDAAFYRMVVAEAPGRGVLGFADVGLARDARWHCDAELFAIYVLKSHQRQGLGQRLFDRVCEAVLAAGHESMYLIALHDNPYRDFYEQLGGRQLAHVPRGAVQGQDAHVIYAWRDLGARRSGSP